MAKPKVAKCTMTFTSDGKVHAGVRSGDGIDGRPYIGIAMKLASEICERLKRDLQKKEDEKAARKEKKG